MTTVAWTDDDDDNVGVDNHSYRVIDDEDFGKRNLFPGLCPHLDPLVAPWPQARWF